MDDRDQAEREQVKALKARRRFLSVWTIVGGILLTGVLVYLMGILSVPVGIVVWSTIIVFCLRGPVSKLEKLGLSRAVATAISYVLMFGVLALVALLMFSPAFGVGGQFTSLIQSVPGYVQQLTDWGNQLYAQYADILSNETVRKWMEEALASVGSWASSFAREGAAGVVSVGGTIASMFMAVGFALVVAFWVLMELPALGRETRRLVSPRRQGDLEMLHVTFTRVMGGYIKGTLLQCAIIGVACAVLFTAIGLPNGAALGGISGLLNIVPIIGPWLGGALAAIIGVFVSPWIAIVALLGTIAIQQIVYTFISPKIMADSVDVHPALTLLALMAGSALGGAMSGLTGSLVGMLASIPAVAVAKSVFVYYFEKRTGRRLVATDGVFFKGTPGETLELDPIADATSPHPNVTAAAERSEQRKARMAKRARRRKDRGGEGESDDGKES
ncbi:MAG: AI-2E family transporter [Gordonibacter sp.]|uniref:AI-2E family transporter n=1 Tax=Gordonibacter sp. TaxID=1968902 RepID=UPI002FCA383F